MNPIHVTLPNGHTAVMPAARTTGIAVTRVAPRDWQRMSWHQRQRYTHRKAAIYRPADDPIVTRPTDRRTIQQRHADELAEILWLIAVGVSPLTIAAQVGSNLRTIERRLQRNGHREEARLFQRAAWDECDCGNRKHARSRMCTACAARVGGRAFAKKAAA